MHHGLSSLGASGRDVGTMSHVPDTSVLQRLTPHGLARKVVAADSARRSRIAARDPKYAAIEERRNRTASETTKLLLSDEHDLGWAEWEYQSQCRGKVKSLPGVALARWVERRPVRRVLLRSGRAVQRLRRGWDDTALWGLDRHLCATLSAQLNALADTTDGWPDTRYESFDGWVAALRENAARLEAYTHRRNSPAHEIHMNLIIQGKDRETTRAAGDAATRHEADVTAAAQEALRWVADHLVHLWD